MVGRRHCGDEKAADFERKDGREQCEQDKE